MFCKNSTVATKHLRKYIIQNHLLEYKCSFCGIDTWNKEKLTLDLDHIDGDIYNNELSNLRFLCPNCHSQTKTYKSKMHTKNIGEYSEQEIIDAIQVTSNIRQTLILLGLSNKGDNYNRVRNIMFERNITYEKAS